MIGHVMMTSYFRFRVATFSGSSVQGDPTPFFRMNKASFMSLTHFRLGKNFEKEPRSGYRLSLSETKTSFFLIFFKNPSLLFSSQT